MPNKRAPILVKIFEKFSIFSRVFQVFEKNTVFISIDINTRKIPFHTHARTCIPYSNTKVWIPIIRTPVIQQPKVLQHLWRR